MNIENAIYTYDIVENIKSAIHATIDGEFISVPLNPANRHYAEIMRQVEAGELTIQEADNS